MTRVAERAFYEKRVFRRALKAGREVAEVAC